MKKILLLIAMCGVFGIATKTHAQSCYITTTGDYICDTTTGTTGGLDVNRSTSTNVPGSNNVFQSNDVRSQYSWMSGVLVNMGLNTSTPAPAAVPHGTISGPSGGSPGTASGSGTAQWSGAECEAGQDPRVAAQQLLLAEERMMTQSYYDALGGQSQCPWSWIPHNGTRYCSPGGANSGGCLTVGVGHLVLESEMSIYAPCGTRFTIEQMNDLFINQDFPRYWNSAVQQTQRMCLSADEASCFLVVLTSINWQLGQAWYTRTTYTNNTWAALEAGQFKVAAQRFGASSYCSQYSHRCNQFVSAINALDASGAAGCDGVPGN